MSYYEPGMGAALVAELNQEKLTFKGGTGLLAIQLRDTCLFADAAANKLKAVRDCFMTTVGGNEVLDVDKLKDLLAITQAKPEGGK